MVDCTGLPRRSRSAGLLDGGTIPAMSPFPDSVTLRPAGRLDADVRVPGSKSVTNRALAIAALADGPVELRGALVAEDSDVMIRALRTLGFEATSDGTSLRVVGRGGRIPASSAELDLRLSGTSIRFLAALVALGRGTYRLTGNARMRERPIEDLLAALRSLGSDAEAEEGTGCPPVVVRASGLRGGTARIAGDRSSQYLSALLMAAPAASGSVTLEVTGELQSKPFVDMTIAVMAAFGVEVEREGYASFRVAPAPYEARAFSIEGDAMAAGYYWAVAAATGGRVRVQNVGRSSLQGDRRLADVLERMGCRVTWTEAACEVIGPAGRLRGGVFDLNDMPDQAQTLAVLGIFADGPLRIDNVWNMRIKETDRLAAMATELRKFGAGVLEERDAIVVTPPDRLPPRVRVDTYGDHRMAMAFAVAGLAGTEVEIADPNCVAKTWPTFFDDVPGAFAVSL